VQSVPDGLERSCTDWVRNFGPIDGVELLQAWFSGRGYAPHRHDTYGICITDLGLQEFDYRGSVERSLPGQVTILHPDELHDGRAGADDGFGYHIVYVDPALIGAAVRAITGKPTPLPFARDPVAERPLLADAIREAFRSGLEPLARDALILRFAEGLLAEDPSGSTDSPPPRLDSAALARAREFLDCRHSVVRSVELERVAGLSRFELARQFRALYGTSPHRYSLQRRLDFARRELRAGQPLVQVALAAGFADQAHFTRMFASVFGMPPGRYATLRKGVEFERGVVQVERRILGPAQVAVEDTQHGIAGEVLQSRIHG
jgi:AraC-like DNA-binding protein